MRPAHILFILLVFLSCLDAALYLHATYLAQDIQSDREIQLIAVAGLGLTDLCVATEARYTRHPSVSDSMAPFMDHPGAIEHFPTGSFWAPYTKTNTR